MAISYQWDREMGRFHLQQWAFHGYFDKLYTIYTYAMGHQTCADLLSGITFTWYPQLDKISQS